LTKAIHKRIKLNHDAHAPSDKTAQLRLSEIVEFPVETTSLFPLVARVLMQREGVVMQFEARGMKIRRCGTFSAFVSGKAGFSPKKKPDFYCTVVLGVWKKKKNVRQRQLATTFRENQLRQTGAHIFSANGCILIPITETRTSASLARPDVRTQTHCKHDLLQ
jgi:hypothetical protein